MTQPPQARPQSPAPRQPPRQAAAAGQTPAFVASELTDSVAARVQEILTSAHETAETVREQSAAATREMLAQAQATVDRDTERIRRDVEARAAQYLAECHRRVDAFADARVRRLRELSDSLIEQTDALNGRFDQVVRLKEQLDSLIRALGGAAEETAREVKRPAITLPTVAQFHGETGGSPGDQPAASDPDQIGGQPATDTSGRARVGEPAGEAGSGSATATPVPVAERSEPPAAAETADPELPDGAGDPAK
jgi:hypothetical protein